MHHGACFARSHPRFGFLSLLSLLDRGKQFSHPYITAKLKRTAPAAIYAPVNYAQTKADCRMSNAFFAPRSPNCLHNTDVIIATNHWSSHISAQIPTWKLANLPEPLTTWIGIRNWAARGGRFFGKSLVVIKTPSETTRADRVRYLAGPESASRSPGLQISGICPVDIFPDSNRDWLMTIPQIFSFAYGNLHYSNWRKSQKPTFPYSSMFDCVNANASFHPGPASVG